MDIMRSVSLPSHPVCSLCSLFLLLSPLLSSLLRSLLNSFKYEYHTDFIQQTKIILEGEIWLEAVGPEKGTAEIIKAKAGDVLRIAKGTVVSFTSPSSGKG